ncbi:hypothetical protein GCM10027416_04700 [Okibacterium endophyticum]
MFVVHDEHGWEVYDIDDQTLHVVHEWAAGKAAERPGAYSSIAIRIVNDQGRGLLWLTLDPDDPDAAAGAARTPPDDPTAAVTEMLHQRTFEVLDPTSGSCRPLLTVP